MPDAHTTARGSGQGDVERRRCTNRRGDDKRCRCTGSRTRGRSRQLNGVVVDDGHTGASNSLQSDARGTREVVSGERDGGR